MYTYKVINPNRTQKVNKVPYICMLQINTQKNYRIMTKLTYWQYKEQFGTQGSLCHTFHTNTTQSGYHQCRHFPWHSHKQHLCIQIASVLLFKSCCNTKWHSQDWHIASWQTNKLVEKNNNKSWLLCDAIFSCISTYVCSDLSSAFGPEYSCHYP